MDLTKHYSQLIGGKTVRVTVSRDFEGNGGGALFIEEEGSGGGL